MTGKAISQGKATTRRPLDRSALHQSLSSHLHLPALSNSKQVRRALGLNLRGGTRRRVGIKTFVRLESVAGTGLADQASSIRLGEATMAEQRLFGCHAMRLIIWYDVGNG